MSQESRAKLNRAFDLVEEFHRAFDHPIASSPRTLTPDRAKARADWMREEVDEFLEATELDEQLDAMIDLIYFALGTLVEMGLKPDPFFEIVHQANMSKLWPDGKPRRRPDGKTIKPEGWKDPRNEIIRALVNSYTPYQLEEEKVQSHLEGCLRMVWRARFQGVKPWPRESWNQVSGSFPDGIEYIQEFFTQNGLAVSNAQKARLRDIGKTEATELIRGALDENSCVLIGFGQTDLFSGRPVHLVVSLDDENRILLIEPGPDQPSLKFLSFLHLRGNLPRGEENLWIIRF